MGLEIERKFLVSSDAWRESVTRSERLRQGYLAGGEGGSVRVRSGPGRAWINIKGATLGARRLEFEYEIPFADAETILDELCIRPLVEKTRNWVEFRGRQWEVDVFHGDNQGLVVAEIELADEHESFELPPWAGEEVTHDPKYYNVCLVDNPYKRWPPKNG